MEGQYKKLIETLTKEIIQNETSLNFEDGFVTYAWKRKKNKELLGLQDGHIDKKRVLEDIVSEAARLGYGLIYKSFCGELYMFKVLKFNRNTRKEIKGFGDEFLNDICTFGNVSFQDLVEKNAKGFLDHIDSNFDIVKYAIDKEVDGIRDEKISKIIAGDMRRGLVKAYILDNKIVYVSNTRIWQNKGVIGGLKTSLEMAIKENRSHGYRICKIQSKGVQIVGAYDKDTKDEMIENLKKEYVQILKNGTQVEIGGKHYICKNILDGLEIVGRDINVELLIQRYIALEMIKIEHGIIEFTGDGSIRLDIVHKKLERNIIENTCRKELGQVETGLTVNDMNEKNLFLERACKRIRIDIEETLTSINRIISKLGYEIKVIEESKTSDDGTKLEFIVNRTYV